MTLHRLFFKTTLFILLLKTYNQELSKKEINKTKDYFYIKMEERNIDIIEEIVREKFIPNNINVSSELESLKMDILQDLNELEQRLKPKKEPQNVRPVFKWGQTYRRVFIHLKYSHRFDAPGCLDIYNQTLKLLPLDKKKEDNDELDQNEEQLDNDEESEQQNNEASVFTGSVKGRAEGRTLKFSAECQVADSVFRYLLNFDLYGEVTAWNIDKGKINKIFNWKRV